MYCELQTIIHEYLFEPLMFANVVMDVDHLEFELLDIRLCLAVKDAEVLEVAKQRKQLLGDRINSLIQ